MISSSFFLRTERRFPFLMLLWLMSGSLAAQVMPAPSAAAHASMREYLTHRWSSTEGLYGGRINAIAQTPDGYLWTGSDNGLQRFDGFTFQTMQPPVRTMAPIRHVLSLTLDRDGSLWIYCQDARLIHYTNGQFEIALSISHREPAITSMAAANDRGLYAVGLFHGLMRLKGGTIEQFPLHTTALLIAMAQAADGRLWIGTRESGIITWKDNVATPITEGVPDLKVNCFLPMQDGTVWIGTDNGVALWNGQRVVIPLLPPDMQHEQVLSMAQDHEHHLWIGTQHGLIHYDGSTAAWLAKAKGQVAITALFEDQQGDLWFGDGDALERISETPILHFGAEDGFPSGRYGPVYADTHDRTWFAPIDGGLYWERDGVPHPVTLAGLDHDVVYSIDGDRDGLWIGRQRGGLTRLRFEGEGFAPTTFTTRDGLSEDNVFAVRTAHDGSVWAGTLTRGLSHFDHGHFTTFTRSDGLASKAVSAIEEDARHRLWIGTPEGLSLWDGLSWKTWKYQDGLPSSEITSLAEDPTGILWIGTSSGLAMMQGDQLRSVIVPTLEGPVRGVLRDPQGRLWIATRTQLLSVPAAILIEGRVRQEQVRLFGPPDGLQSSEGDVRSRVMVADSHGRTWFSTASGIGAGAQLPDQDLQPAAPQIQSVETDAGPVPMGSGALIPAGSRRVVFHYTGIYLRDPTRIQFRYQLENFDEGWSAPTGEHAAVYTNLAPGTYRFRVMATNGNGSWDAIDSTQTITVRPLLWQSWPFKIAFFVSFLLLGVWIYRARIHFLISQANMRSEERLIERTAIARELHDTLLQSFHALILFFQMGVDQIPEDTAARGLLEDALKQSDDIMREGRERLVSLRATMASPELNRIFAAACETLYQLYPCEYTITVQGEPRAMQAIAQEELAYLGREALNNAFRHAKATRIEVWLYYKPERFRIIISDNGQGIPDAVMRFGAREGHWGLTGMRERARKIGANFHLHTRPDTGTLVDVKLDAPLIYESHARTHHQSWLAPWITLWRYLVKLGSATAVGDTHRSDAPGRTGDESLPPSGRPTHL
ncbi:ligand-binding sensor domain-containing protein [Bryocella elongata]|uniref:Ligand-binding sensor domain-containing protein n=1 Tax=Bryocella elongata TaxID=863522 RepID=A0A1H5ZLK0_9BACT|nr:sensor histidine kinase [Bryocella elongata]SEG37010.1 ligand-binding sensor domain-containing protein [Bryocella elongata]